MVKRALDHRREERTEEVQEVEEGIRTKTVEDDDGPGQGENTEEARGAEGERRSKTTDTVDGAAALDPAPVGENSCWNCGTPGKEGNLCTCRGCRKVGHKDFQYMSLIIVNRNSHQLETTFPGPLLQ